jgi:ATP/maltotriose-dependent transcriptional regulator MalT
MTVTRSNPEPVAGAREALARGAWNEAVAGFQANLAREEAPETLEGLAAAAWWLDDETLTMSTRERSYRLYRDRGDVRGAARVAIALAWDSILWGGRVAVATGWLERARRLLEGIETSPEHGWLAVREAEIALRVDRDVVSARAHAARAAKVGESLGAEDLQVVAHALEGLALVNEGEVADGMRLLDEAVAAATSGELDDLMWIGKVCCYLIYACEGARDYDRATQWCEWVTEFCERWGLRPLFSVCRTQYASVLIARGRWDAAEAELEGAVRMLGGSRRALLGEGVVRLGELRRRQGRVEEAEELFAQVEFHPISQLGRAAIALDRAQGAAAADLLRAYLRRVPRENRLARVAGLEPLVGAEISRRRLGEARTALAELQAIAEAVDTGPVRGSALLAEGQLARATGDVESARRCLEDAVELLDRCCGPYEAARARSELAKLTRKDESGAPGPLTPRELEVLRLVADGLSNREIATRLVLSEHTVHRHVANILRKLGAPSRAAAAADAARAGLL